MSGNGNYNRGQQWQGQRGGNYQQPRGQQERQTTTVVTLQQAGFGTGVITADKFGAVAGKLDILRQNFNIIGAMSLSAVPAGFALDFKMVSFNGTFTEDQEKAKSNGDFYIVQGGNLAFTKSSLNKLQDLGAVSWISAECGRVDNGMDPHYCMYRAVGRVLNTDGRIKTIMGEKEVDLREGSDQLFKIYQKKKERMTEEQIYSLRYHILAHAETKAKLRALREHFGIRSYTRQEALKPFVLVVLVPQLDMSNPEVAKMVAANALGIVDQVYGGPKAPALPTQGVGYLGTQYLPGPPAPRALGAGQEPPPYMDDDDDYGPPPPQQSRPQQTTQETSGGQGQQTMFQGLSDSSQQGAEGQTGEDPFEEQQRLMDKCEECGQELDPRVADYSFRQYGKLFCRQHQAGKPKVQR